MSANKNIIIFFALLFISLFSHNIFSQPADIDSLTAGKYYKVTLYNDKEFIGKLTYTDSVYIKISDNKNIYKIRKDDVISVSE